MLREFVEQLEPKLLGQLVEVVFEKMKLAGEAGSLLKIEEEIREAVEQARRQWRVGPIAKQMRLFEETNHVGKPDDFDLSGVTDAQFFEKAEARVVEALRSYAEKALDGQRLQRRLFTEDAVRGFAFVDQCHKQFDVVLMNPPFGLPTTLCKDNLTCRYSETWKDMYAMFCERAMALLDNGYLGTITPNMWQYTRQLRDFRHSLLVKQSLIALAELGQGVMDDAAVEASVWIASDVKCGFPLLALDLLDSPREDREKNLSKPSGAWKPIVHLAFERIEDMPLCHHVNNEVLRLWLRDQRLCDIAEIAKGTRHLTISASCVCGGRYLQLVHGTIGRCTGREATFSHILQHQRYGSIGETMGTKSAD